MPPLPCTSARAGSTGPKKKFETPEGKALLKEWGLPEHLVGVGHCIVGYGDGPEPAAAPRKPDFIKFVK